MLCRKTPRRLVTPQFISPAVLFAALAATSSATAANWEIAPRVEAGYRYSDNYHLEQPGTEVEVSGGEADAQVDVPHRRSAHQFEITPRISATYFPDEPEEDSIDYYLDARLVDVTPRRRIGVRREFSQEDVCAASCRAATSTAAIWATRRRATRAASSSTIGATSFASRRSSAYDVSQR